MKEAEIPRSFEEAVIESKQPVLEISIGGHAPVMLPLTERRLRLGQSPFNDLSFPDAPIARQQCELLRQKRSYSLSDRSGVGTWINGHSATEHELAEGDRIELGDVTLRYHLQQVHTDNLVSDKTAILASPRKQPTSRRLSWTVNGEKFRRTIEEPLLIGASHDNHIQLTDSYVSGRHCQLIPTDQGVVLRDLYSTNGTWIDELRVGEVILPAKQRFRIGQTDFLFEGDSPAEQSRQPSSFYGLVGSHPSMMNLHRALQRVAPLSDPVLLYGETGCGKELAARAIHEQSSRAAQPFVAVNCGALAAQLIESELFGHEKGAFTGATRKHTGAFDAAKDGTVFLDEIGELPLELQPKLLRALEQAEVRPVGSERVHHHKARIIAATNRDLAEMVQEGSFRKDLFYRLSVLPITISPLRERREDIPLLTEHFLRAAGKNLRLSKAASETLFYYYWPGNVRELKNAVTASLCYHPEAVQQGLLDDEHLVLNGPGVLTAALKQETAANSQGYQGQTLQEVETDLIREALLYFDGNKSQVSRALGISKSTLYERIRRYRLEDH